MELLLAVAVMAVAVASWIIATTFRIRIRENTTAVAQARTEITACADRLQQAEKRLRSQSDHDQARWADEFEMVRQQIGEAHVQLARHDAELHGREDRLGDQGTEDGQPGPPRQEIERLQQAVRDLSRRTAQAEKIAARAEETAAGAEEAAAGAGQAAQQQLAGLARDVCELSRHVDALRQHIRAQLDHEVTTTRGGTSHRVLVGGIYAERPSAAAALPVLYDSFLQELGLEMLFRDSPDRFAGRCYLSWDSLNGQSPEQRLDALLRACPGDGETAPGLGELRRLLLALHHAGPATLQAGPLVVFRTADQLAGAVLAGPEAALLDDQSTLPPPEECRKLLGALGEDRLADLSGWADARAS